MRLISIAALVVAMAATNAAKAPAEATDPGAQAFADNCAACHQPEGQGIAGAFPALAKNKFVVGDPRTVAATLLNGRGGMPAFADSLADEDLAAAVSYVRHSWGNKAAPIPVETFAAVRNAPKAAPGKPIPGH